AFASCADAGPKAIVPNGRAATATTVIVIRGSLRHAGCSIDLAASFRCGAERKGRDPRRKSGSASETQAFHASLDLRSRYAPMALNACELEIDLFCRGLRVASDVSLEGARGISRTRAGLGSGLEIVLPTGSWLKRDIWMNVPVVERFVERSPYGLRGSPDAGYAIYDDRGFAHYPVRLPSAPRWYTRLTSRDVPMSKIGVLQGTYL